MLLLTNHSFFHKFRQLLLYISFRQTSFFSEILEFLTIVTSMRAYLKLAMHDLVVNVIFNKVYGL